MAAPEVSLKVVMPDKNGHRRVPGSLLVLLPWIYAELVCL